VKTVDLTNIYTGEAVTTAQDRDKVYKTGVTIAVTFSAS
jgi:hypothetical protein